MVAKTKRAVTTTKSPTLRKQLELLRETNKALDELVQELMGDRNSWSREVSELKYNVQNLEYQAIGYRAVISYLESKRENNPV